MKLFNLFRLNSFGSNWNLAVSTADRYNRAIARLWHSLAPVALFRSLAVSFVARSL